ncbi:2',5'-phosphodiesterase 12-like [Lineus longissimus]|uniref:2',5'-phosphodiesterase 12-like n=1 Tax=Lineus longissimus TaxID=88925 RepID=UPI00315DB63D
MNFRNLNSVRCLFSSVLVRHIWNKPKAMPYIAVRRVEGQGRIQMTLSFSLNEKPVRTFNFDRSCDETVGATLQRISANVQKRFMKKTKKKKAKESDDASAVAAEVADENYDAELFCGGEKVDDVTLNGDAWGNGSKLCIAGKEFDVTVNIPTIKSIEFPSSLMSGFPVFPKLETEFIDKWATQFIWYKGCQSSNETSQEDTSAQATTSEGKEGQTSCPITWTKVGEGSSYTPSNEDIGSNLKIEATPIVDGRSGESVEIISKETIDAGPGFCPFENRHLYTKKVADDDSFRVISYNILADVYADSDFSRDNLYPYCPPYALAIDYRRQLLIKETLGYNADIICLQEVDRKVFNHELKPVMESANLDGLLLLKGGETPEGCAIFFRKSKFRLLGEHNISVTEALQMAPENETLWGKVLSVEPLCERVLKRNTSLQVLMLESTVQPGKTICIATTHLYFHPTANHIRLIQGAVCLYHLETVVAQYRQKGHNPAVVFCGDLNSTPSNGLIHFLNEKHIAAKDPKWFPSDSPREEDCGGQDLSHTFDFKSACGTPDFTNYTGGFQDCLDYVFIDKSKLDVTQVVPLPSLEEVTQYVALPNVVFPSDHLALVCDVQWKKDPSEQRSE